MSVRTSPHSAPALSQCGRGERDESGDPLPQVSRLVATN